jgi:hypothetical protein
MPGTNYLLKADDEGLREDLRELARLAVKLFGEGATEFAATRAGELVAGGEKDAAAVWYAVEAEIKRLQALEPEGGARH